MLYGWGVEERGWERLGKALGGDTAEWSPEWWLEFPWMEMRREGLLRQKEQHGKRCVNKKGEVGDPSAVETGGEQWETRLHRKGGSTLFAWLFLGSHWTFLWARKLYNQRRTGQKEMGWVPWKIEGKSRAMSNWNRPLGTGRWSESKVRLSLQKGWGWTQVSPTPWFCLGAVLPMSAFGKRR